MLGLKYKSGKMETDEMLGLIVGGIVLILLLVLLSRLIWTNSGSEVDKASSSYFDSFMSEVSKADEGKTGEFIMWQENGGDGKGVALVYFNDKYKVDIGDDKIGQIAFVSFNNENSFCFCSWEKGEISCKNDNCAELKYPLVYEGESSDHVLKLEDNQFLMVEGGGIKIEKKGEEYEVHEIQ